MGSRDNMQRVEGDGWGGKQGCLGGNCSLCTASKFMLKCWECACEGGKFKYKNNGFHRCRTESGHTDVDWRQDSRAGHQEIEEVETLCAKCYSGYEEDMLLCDGYVPPRIVPQKKRDSFCFAIPVHHSKFVDTSRDTQMRSGLAHAVP